MGSTELCLSQTVAGHVSQRSTELNILADTIRVVSRLVIPQAHSRFREYKDRDVSFA